MRKQLIFLWAILGISLHSSVWAQESSEFGTNNSGRYAASLTTFGLGIASSSRVTSTSTSLSVIASFNRDQAVQGYLGVGGTSPTHYGIGAIYKHTVWGASYSGLHIGGGIGLGGAPISTVSGSDTGIYLPGSDTSFFFNIIGNVGVHFYVPSLSRILISFDAGPVLTSFNNNTDFTIGAFSQILGLSVHYLF